MRKNILRVYRFGRLRSITVVGSTPVPSSDEVVCQTLWRWPRLRLFRFLPPSRPWVDPSSKSVLCDAWAMELRAEEGAAGANPASTTSRYAGVRCRGGAEGGCCGSTTTSGTASTQPRSSMSMSLAPQKSVLEVRVRVRLVLSPRPTSAGEEGSSSSPRELSNARLRGPLRVPDMLQDVVLDLGPISLPVAVMWRPSSSSTP
mmetsp:Transcript_11964/g.27994  ORF Transcript_11964/g.27994 Transcript_11964/m.27994 type:complete len:202 (-) Transcript_11964:464-1069(-)